MARSPDIASSSGASFFNNVIDPITPWAKCLIISASLVPSELVAVSSAPWSKLRFLPKENLTSAESIRTCVEWLFTPLGKPELVMPDGAMGPVITELAPPWKELRRYIAKIPDYLHTMSPSQFELLAGEIFKTFGWEVEFTSRTRDGGYDIIAVRKMWPTNMRVLVEAKRFSPKRPVGVDIVRSHYGVKQAKAASQLVLVTSSFVSLDAKKEFGRVVPWELDFFERDKILSWCREQPLFKVDGDLGV